MGKELKSTWLVQRLHKPQGNFDNPFNFGGGLKNGGLSDDAMKLLRPIFSFDYMGSAEFEFGAIPECFKRMAKGIDDYGFWTLTINKMPIYVIADKDLKDDINERIKELSKDKIRCKGWTEFNAAVGLSKYTDKDKVRSIGWLEIDNGFLFFTSEDAAKKVADLFEIKS